MLKAAQPKLALAMVYVVLAVLLSTTSGGSIAAPFGEAFAQANLLWWAVLLSASGLELRNHGTLTQPRWCSNYAWRNRRRQHWWQHCCPISW